MIIGYSGVGNLPAIGDSYLIQSKTYNMGVLDELNLGRYGANIIMVKRESVGLPIVMKCQFQGTIAVPFSLTLKNIIQRYKMDILLAPHPNNRIPKDTVINTLFWAYGNEIDRIWRKMDTMKPEMIIGTAEGSQLDDFWGAAYQLPRRTGQSDTDYKAYLQNYSDVLTCCGTIPRCQKIIDRIIGMDGETTIESRSPCIARITFASDAGMRAAITKKDLLKLMSDRMFAAGVSSDIRTPLVDLNMKILMRGVSIYEYFLTAYIGRSNLQKEYIIRTTLAKRPEFEYYMKIANQKMHTESIKTFLAIRKRIIKSTQFDLLNKNQNALKNCDFDLCSQKLNLENLYIDIISCNPNKEAYQNMSIVNQKSKIARTKYDIRILNQSLIPYDMNIIIKNIHFMNTVQFGMITNNKNLRCDYGISILIMNWWL
jgi:hypothetical protein